MKQELINRINNLNSENKETILSLLEDCLFFSVDENSVNNSNIGNIELPISFENKNFENLKLIAKINLDDLDFFPVNFPKKGILLFFINTNDLGYRFPFNKDEFNVIYIDNINLINDFNKINKPNLVFKNSISFPSYQENIIETKNFDYLDSNIIQEVEDFIQSNFYNFDYDTNHQIFGHPVAIQGTVRFWWSLSYLGYKYEDVDKLNEDEMTLIRKQEENFILLLEVNFGDPKINIETDIFGDSIAYFGIHKEDLINLDFNKVVLIMQNT